ncbi:IS3 family transposase [Amycolatopsis sp. NPDC047767]|uniref:IS3 family transposase n=1 Tax=Amycolatopsis sp. NPDC047767 TaxID=3156765 RepID=UPI003453C35B
MPERRRKFSPEFRDEAVKMVANGDRPIAQVARELGINPGTLGNWVAAYRKENPVDEEPLSVSERARLRELERENRELKTRNEFLGKSCGLLRPGVSVSTKFAFIDGEKDNFPISKMCAWLGVSRAGYYEWRDRAPSLAARRRERLAAMITAIFEANHGTYGYRRVHAVLLRSGEQVSDELVRELMRHQGLVSCQPRPWRPTTTEADQAHRIPDLVARDFTATEPGTKLVGDITYLATDEGWVYLATVIDCYSKMVVGWAMADHYKTSLITAALDSAAGTIDIRPGCIFHSDRGSNYTSYEFATTLANKDMRQSVGRTGICWDNAMAESFFGTLKNEWTNRMTFTTRAQVRQEVVKYIEGFYNRQRLHSGLDYKTPLEVHNEYLNRQLAA